MANTSSSGSVKRVAAVQSRLRPSRQTPFASTLSITPTLGAAMPAWLVAGPSCEPGTVVPETVHGVSTSKPAHGELGRGGHGLVARLEDGDVDRRAVGRDRERARRVAEQRHDRDRHAADGGAEVGRIEDPDVGATDSRRGELRIARAGHAGQIWAGALLAAVRGGDEGARPAGAGEDDVARLVADEEGVDDVRRAVGHVDDADAVRDGVDDPDIAVGRDGDGDRIHADGSRAVEGDPARGHVEDVERAVGGVGDEEARPVGGERERAHRAALERQLVAGRGRRGRRVDGGRSVRGAWCLRRPARRVQRPSFRIRSTQSTTRRQRERRGTCSCFAHLAAS